MIDRPDRLFPDSRGEWWELAWLNRSSSVPFRSEEAGTPNFDLITVRISNMEDNAAIVIDLPDSARGWSNEMIAERLEHEILEWSTVGDERFLVRVGPFTWEGRELLAVSEMRGNDREAFWYLSIDGTEVARDRRMESHPDDVPAEVRKWMIEVAREA